MAFRRAKYVSILHCGARSLGYFRTKKRLCYALAKATKNHSLCVPALRCINVANFTIVMQATKRRFQSNRNPSPIGRILPIRAPAQAISDCQVAREAEGGSCTLCY